MGEQIIFEPPQSRIEAILQNILGAFNKLEPPQSRVEEVLLSILNETTYENAPASRVEELLLAIKYETEYTDPALSRVEAILYAKLNNLEYTEEPESNIEKLLLIWLTRNKDQQNVVIFHDINYSILETVEVEGTDYEITYTPPSKDGFRFAGWVDRHGSFEPLDITTIHFTDSNHEVHLHTLYLPLQNQSKCYFYWRDIIGDHGETKPVSKSSYNYGKSVYFDGKNDNAKYFYDTWTDEELCLVSSGSTRLSFSYITESKDFTMVRKNVTDRNPKKDLLLINSFMGTAINGGAKYITFSSNRSCTGDYSLVKFGVIWYFADNQNYDMNNLYYNSPNASTTSKTSPEKSYGYMYNKAVANGRENWYLYARHYAIYKHNETGEETLLYSPSVKTTYNELINRT